jgi:hypothetical protein
MKTILFFLLIYLIIYFVGKGIFLASRSKINTFFEIPIFYFYPIIALFYIGNFTIILNFFFRISNLITLIVLIPPLIINIFNYKNFKVPNISLRNILSFLVTPILIGVSSFDINFSYDAGLYHLNHQNWIRNSKIIIGLVNNHLRFGYSSIIEYINANFWINDNFIILHFINLIFIVFIFQIMYYLLFTKYYTFSIIFFIYGLLDNVGFGGGKNGFIEIESIAKQDMPFAIIFFISSIFLYMYINKTYTDINNQDIILLFMFTLFSVQIRLLGAINLIVFFLITVYKFKPYKTFIFIFSKSAIFTILGLFFILKNTITSNCLLYPINFLCSDKTSSSGVLRYADAKKATRDLADFHVAISSKNFRIWFSQWSNKEVNLQVFKNMIITFAVILFVVVLLKIINKEMISSKNKFCYASYCIVSLLLWLLTAPGIRLGVGVLLTCIMFLGAVKEPKLPRMHLEKYAVTLSIFYIVVVALVPRISSYSVIESSFINDSIRKITPPTVMYVDNDLGYGVLPEEGDQCWINIECVHNEKVVIGETFSFISFKDN